jgi:hypothetical protein
MKNWNDAGTVNYDAETNTNYTTVALDFLALGRKQEFALRIPLKIREALKLEHYDAALALGRRTFDAVALRLILHGCQCIDSVAKAAHFFALKAMLEQLYTDFTLEQARAGNQVWATPGGMQDIGPRPENDFD